MEIKLDKYILLNGIKTVIRGLGRSTSLPILGCIKFEATGNGLALACTDLELAIQTEIECEVLAEGAVALDAKLVNDIVAKLPDGEVTIKVNNNKAIITAGKSKFEVVTSNVLDFPKMPEVGNDGLAFEIDEDVLLEGIRRVVVATAEENDTRPILTGANLSINENELVFVALDGFRLAYYKAVLDEPITVKVNATIPRDALAELSRLVKGAEKVKVSIGSNLASFALGPTTISTRLLEGEFIDYKQILRADSKLRVKVNNNEILNGVDRATVLSKDGRNNLVKLTFNGGLIKVEANSDAGEVVENIKAIEQEGEELEIAFNSKYLMDGLKSITSPEINIYLEDPISPAIIREGDNEENYLYLLLPVRILK